MKSDYEFFNHNYINKKLLDSICVGDLIKCNDWNKPLRVKAVSENYFVMTSKIFGKTQYSICQKQIPDWRRNFVSGRFFIIGLENMIFNVIGDYDLKENAVELLKNLESGEYEMSVRTSVDLLSISIKKENKYE